MTENNTNTGTESIPTLKLTDEEHAAMHDAMQAQIAKIELADMLVGMMFDMLGADEETRALILEGAELRGQAMAELKLLGALHDRVETETGTVGSDFGSASDQVVLTATEDEHGTFVINI